MHNFLGSDETFRLQNLLRFFRKTEDKEPMRVPEADFSLLAQGEPKSIFSKKSPTKEEK